MPPTRIWAGVRNTPAAAVVVRARMGVWPTTRYELWWKPSRSRGYGPPVLRKLMYLAAMNLKRCSERHRAYYEGKVAQGKSAGSF